MSDPLIENFEIGLYEQYLEDLEKKYFQGVITWGPEKGEPYYSKTQNEMIFAMNKLYELLEKNNIKLSLAVYPWPQQLEFNDENSKHVKMWENFCKKKCTKFINFFPFFFEEKRKTSYIDVFKKYYFWNDVHFNAEGNKVIAERLIKEF